MRPEPVNHISDIPTAIDTWCHNYRYVYVNIHVYTYNTLKANLI